MHVFRKFVIRNENGELKKNAGLLTDKNSLKLKNNNLEDALSSCISFILYNFPKWINICKVISSEQLETV